MSAIEIVIDSLIEGAERIEHDLGPGGDWQPILAAMHDNEVGILAIQPGWLEDGGRKDALVALIGKTFDEIEVEAVGMVLSNWTVDLKDASDEQMAYAYRLAQANRLSEHPLKREQLLVTAYSKTETRSRHRRIKRTRAGTPRLIGEWQTFPYEQSGRFAVLLASIVGYELPEPPQEWIDKIMQSDPRIP